jgi:hypothetical protein
MGTHGPGKANNMTAISQLHGPASDAEPSEETTSVVAEHSAGSAYACPACREGERTAAASSDKTSRHVA